jgi:hypothetical protein
MLWPTDRLDREEAPPEEEGEREMSRKTKAASTKPGANSSREEEITRTDRIIDILLRAQKHVEKLGGRLSARVIVWPAQIIHVEVSYEKVPGRRSGGFGIGVLGGKLKQLEEDLVRTLDYHLGPDWREEK